MGVALTKLLLGEGHDVIIACRESSKCNIPVNDHLRIVRYKGLDNIKALRNSVSHADVLIHLAWGGTDHAVETMQSFSSQISDIPWMPYP